MPRTLPWATHGTLKRTETYTSGDVIRIAPGEGFTNVRLTNPANVTRVELFVTRPSSGVEPATQTLLSTTRSQFHNMTIAIPIIPQTGHDASDRFNVVPYMPGLRPFIVLYSFDDLAPRETYTVDIVSTAVINTRYQYALLERTYVAVNKQDFQQPLRLGGPAMQISVRLYKGSGTERVDAVAENVYLNVNESSVPMIYVEPVWTLPLDGKISLARVGAKITIESATPEDAPDGYRVEQVCHRNVKFGDGSVFYL